MATNTQDIINVQLAEYTPVAAIERPDRSGWLSYGEDNLFPQYLKDLSETSPIHGALCVSISEMIAGKGIASNTAQDRLDALKMNDVVYAASNDMKRYGGFYLEVIYSMDRASISKVICLPYEECRLSIDEDENVNGIWHSLDWSAPRKQRNKPAYIPVFNPSLATEHPKQVYICRMYTSGNLYPRPDYWSAVNYIELSKQISIFHVNGISNGLFPSTIVSFFNGDLPPEKKREMMNEWENKLSGAKNAGKFIMTFNEPGNAKPEINSFPISDADKLYEYLSSASRTEILTAHRVTTPLLFGIRGEGTGFGSNKEEMQTGLEIFTNQVIEPYQRRISLAIEEILSIEFESIECYILPNSWLGGNAVQSTDNPTNTTQVTDVAATALNGAQVTSLLEIITQTSQGLLPLSTARGVVAAAFPTLSPMQLDNIFNGLSTTNVPVTQSAELADGYEPTKEMAASAERGLAWRDEYNRGGTAIGVARARDISNMRNLSLDTVKRMNSYFARHEVDKQANGWNDGEDGFPSAGRIAWELWGGDAGRDWAARIVERVKKEELSLSIADELIALGEDAPEDWICIDSYASQDDDDVDTENIDKLFKLSVSSGTARPNSASEQDKKIDQRRYYVRYRYAGKRDAERPFCVKMLDANKLYRKEDIIRMGGIAVNAGWGPHGADTYSIWKWKGGGNCSHYWQKELYISAKGFGLDLASPTVRKQAWSKAEAVGYKVKNEKEVDVAPRNLPYRGFLPSNPWYKRNGEKRNA
jgi:hypothetical protein